MGDNLIPGLLAVAAAAAVWLIVWGFRDRHAVAARDHRRRVVHGEMSGDERAGQSRRAMMRSLRRRRSALVNARRRAAAARAATIRFLVITVGLAAVVGMIGYVVGGPLVGGGATVVAAIIPVMARRQKRSRRQNAINGQLPELLQSVAGGLRAGQTFVQTLDSAGREIGEPLQTELELMLRELELGVSMDDALLGLRSRVKDEDFDLVVDAVLIQRQIGGNLAEVLTNISVTIRDRIRIRGEVDSLTGQARLSGWVLSALPVFIGTIMYLMSPEYMDPLFTQRIGQMAIAVAVVSEIIGMLIMRRIANVKV